MNKRFSPYKISYGVWNIVDNDGEKYPSRKKFALTINVTTEIVATNIATILNNEWQNFLNPKELK